MPLPNFGFSHSENKKELKGETASPMLDFVRRPNRVKLSYRYIPEHYPRNQRINLNKINRIVFENAYGLGDVFVSRSLIDRITREFPNKDFFYIHDYSKHLLKDLNLEEISHGDFYKKFNTRSQFYIPEDIKSYFKDPSSAPEGFKLKQRQDKNWYLDGEEEPALSDIHLQLAFIKDTMHVNTWYHAPLNAINEYGASCWPVLVYNFNELFSLLGIEENLNENPNKYLPQVDYATYELEPYKSRINSISSKFDRVVLVCNEIPSTAPIVRKFDFDSLIKPYTAKNQNTAFIFTTKTNYKDKNIFFTDDVLEAAPRPDLIYMGYIARHCDLIIGRNSGPFTYCMTKENLIDSPKKFLSTTDHPMLCEFLPDRDEKSLEFVSPYNEPDFLKMLDRNLNK